MASAPQKPWERSGRNSSLASTIAGRKTEWDRARERKAELSTPNLASSTPATRSSTLRDSVGASTSRLSSAASTPRLPPRSSRGTYGGYGSSLGAYGGSYGSYGGYGGYGGSRYGGYGYGSYGGYGSRYGSRYGGYGGYGSRYGGYSRYGSRYGGYGGYGGYGSHMGELGPEQGKEGYSWMDNMHYFVEGFGRFAQILDDNCDAMYGSFSSLLRMFETFGALRREIFFILQSLALFKLISYAANTGRRVLGKPLPPAKLDIQSFKEFDSKKPRRNVWPFVIFMVATIAAPVALNKLWKLIKGHNADNRGVSGARLATALFDFEGQGPDDLSFRRGDVITILNDAEPGWWEGRVNGRVGLLPANYVEIIDDRPKVEPIE